MVKRYERLLYCTGSNPVLTTEGVNPETLKEKVDDGSERRATWSYGRVA